MSPIDHELEQVLASHADDLAPCGDLLEGVEREARGIRRRRGVLTGAAALSVLAIAVAVPLATRGAGSSDPGLGFATQGPSAASTPSAEPSRSPAGQPFADLGWPPRGPRADDGPLANRALAALLHSFDAGHKPDETGVKMLWAGSLPDGRVVAAMQTAEVRGQEQKLFATFYVEGADASDGRIVHRTEVTAINPQSTQVGDGPRQLSAYIDGAEDCVVIIGAPGTGQLEFSTDGRRYTTVETVDGVGIIAVTKGEDRAAYRVRVYDGNGVVAYDGPIDLPSDD